MPAADPTRRRLLVAAAVLTGSPAWAQPSRPHVQLQTDKRAIVVELADDKAPTTVANFLRYVDARRMDAAVF